MQTEYVYVKKRSEFGKRCYFSECNKIEVDIKPEPKSAYSSEYIEMDPINKATQLAKVYALHEVNTTTAEFKNSGMCHTEGGWPKDININDVEQTTRFRRKIEKDELYVHTMQQLLPPMEHCIMQNNACNIYTQYFDDVEGEIMVEPNFCRTVNVYRDPVPVSRSATHISWSPDQGSRIAVSHCTKDFATGVNYSPISYIWDVKNPNKPVVSLKPECPLLALEYNPKDSNILVSGLMTGQVVFWDIRRSTTPIETSSIEHSHRDPCDLVLWINSKTGTEFFSASKDGQIKWWDTRKLSLPTETLVMDLVNPEEQDIDRAIGVSALQFEPSIGTRYMVGLENGTVIGGNRKGKAMSEKLATKFLNAQYGPVVSVERNPNFVKNFLTVGDWTARIWSEDCRESSIVWTPGHGIPLTSGNWSPTKYSTFFLTRMDGVMDAWDVLVQQDVPVLSTKVCDEPLTCIKPHENGKLLAVGSKNGCVYMLQLSDSLVVSQKNDKALFTALLDRESKREKVIEAKNREARLKMKVPRQESTDNPAVSDLAARHRSMGDVKDPAVVQREQEYMAIIEAELARQAKLDELELGTSTGPASKKSARSGKAKD